MFKDAVEKIGRAVRPMHVIRRRFSDNAVLPDIATLFFVNESGFALTSKRVANIIQAAANTDQLYRTYLEKKSSLLHDESYRFSLKRLENDLKLTKASIIQIRYAFMGCGRGKVKIECVQHPKYDLALLHFVPDQGYLYREHVTFAAESPKQGESLCRLGFPLPEFRNFRMNEDADAIEFTDTGKNTSALFALDGTVTRFISDGERAFGIETTNAGPTGLNGAPLFNRNGLVVGMQSGIGIMLLGADIKMETPDRETFVDHGAMHLAVHTHLDVIKDFLRAQNVTFYEA
jgi:hypothetical protein